MEGVLARHHHHHHQLHQQHPREPRLVNTEDEHIEASLMAKGLNEMMAEEKYEVGNDRTMALLVSDSAFTKSALIRAFSSPMPFLLVHLPSLDSEVESGV